MIPRPTALPRHRPPTPPGQILVQEFLEPLGLSQSDLTARMGIPVQRVNQIVRARRTITAETALLLAEALGTTPQLWMNLQTSHDLWAAERQLAQRRARSA
jgi:antitoxin HigA-1